MCNMGPRPQSTVGIQLDLKITGISEEINNACDNLVAGDVRLIAEQGATDARPLNLLSRYTELRHGD